MSPDVACAEVTLVKIKKDLFPLPGCKCSPSLPVLESLLPCSAWTWTIPSICVWDNNYYYWGGQSPPRQSSLFFPLLRIPRYFWSVSPLLMANYLCHLEDLHPVQHHPLIPQPCSGTE